MTDDELDKIVLEINSRLKQFPDLLYQAKQAIKAYTDKARIDELESIKVLNSGKAYCYKKDMLDGGDISVYNRIAQLKGDK
tara:strand:+ start:652 stop:894 length:243 start_codon:yes stop_codon:yes gene_type:complete